MHPFAVGDDDVLLVSSEDVRCFFYIFSVPTSWHRFLAFGRLVPPGLTPDRSGKYYLCSRVLPMGFCNSVSLAQHIHRNGEAVEECVRKGARAGWEAEHRKDRSFCWSNPSFRVYLDNFDLLEKVDNYGIEGDWWKLSGRRTAGYRCLGIPERQLPVVRSQRCKVLRWMASEELLPRKPRRWQNIFICAICCCKKGGALRNRCRLSPAVSFTSCRVAVHTELR